MNDRSAEVSRSRLMNHCFAQQSRCHVDVDIYPVLPSRRADGLATHDTEEGGSIATMRVFLRAKVRPWHSWNLPRPVVGSFASIVARVGIFKSHRAMP